ncbi:hypothetical protein K443DRAFT_681363 [Laccaria amethystina LaAM-08-1]|uniref:Uncharacterized protein n=1 Tax=Laccaria amethystina LaAM-08-1 TaxID=1095629 RepID=A0A0C9X8C7_9AGAR|nr:hypothetical protein K443DRAFT_681363 [Laccaria amethystina LaAM-08-1]
MKILELVRRKTMLALPRASPDLQTTFYTNHDCFTEAAIESLHMTFLDFIPHPRTSTLQG